MSATASAIPAELRGRVRVLPTEALPLDTVLGHLVRLGCEPRAFGGCWTARCPWEGHEPENRYLRIGGNPVLIQCQDGSDFHPVELVFGPKP